jgi:hypothetical protein
MERSDLVAGLRLVAWRTKGGSRRLFCLRWCSEIDEGLEQRVASLPSPQHPRYCCYIRHRSAGRCSSLVPLYLLSPGAALIALVSCHSRQDHCRSALPGRRASLRCDVVRRGRVAQLRWMETVQQPGTCGEASEVDGGTEEPWLRQSGHREWTNEMSEERRRSCVRVRA